MINAYNLNQGDSQYFGNDVNITLIEKSDSEQYLFKVVGGAGGFIILIDKKSDEVEFFCDIDEFESSESINEILEGIESGDLEQAEEPEDWFYNAELIDDLIGDSDEFFEKN